MTAQELRSRVDKEVDLRNDEVIIAFMDHLLYRQIKDLLSRQGDRVLSPFGFLPEKLQQWGEAMRDYVECKKHEKRMEMDESCSEWLLCMLRSNVNTSKENLTAIKKKLYKDSFWILTED